MSSQRRDANYLSDLCFGIRLDVVWTVARQELPALLPEIEAILAE